MVTVNPATHACAQNLLPCFPVLKEVYLGAQRRIAYMQDGVLHKFFSTRACVKSTKLQPVRLNTYQ